eukprot:g12698.t2
MMPLPFVKVTAKAFKRSLADDTADSDSDSSSSSSSSTTITTTSGSGSDGTTSTNATNSEGGNGERSSIALNDLRDLNYTVPLPTHDADDLTPDESSSQKAPSTDASGSSTSATTTSTSSTSGSTTSGSTTSSTVSGSGSSTTAASQGGTDATTASSSGFSLDVSLDPNDVIDSRTGRHIFAKTDREVKITVLPEQVETPPPTLSVDPSGKPPSIATQAIHAINLGMHTARSSMQSSRTVQSTSRGLKKAKKTALLTLRIGEYVVKTQVVGPVVNKAIQEWKSFNRFRDRHQADRRSKTLDWFEERMQTMKREEGIKRQQEQDERRAKWRARLKMERTERQRSDFLNETRAEGVHRADLDLAASLEKEKVRNYFLGNNDGWQMQTLTRHVQEDENRQRQQEVDAVADRVREGDVRRQAAADAYLAEYDRAEVTTQATLQIMRRSGIIAGVNAPPPEIEDAPLETDTYLLLRLKQADILEKRAETGTGTTNITNTNGGRQLPPPLGKAAVRQSGSSSGGGGGSILPSFVAGAANEHPQRIDRLKIPGTEPRSSLPEPPENSRKAAQTNNNNAVATRGGPTGSVAAEGPRKTSRTTTAGGTRPRRAGGLNRGKKRSSGAFEVDLLRFRGVEEIRGWKIGVHGGESLAADLANGACPRLSVLRLGWCCMGDRGARAIVRSLCGGGGASAAGRTLKELDLCGNAVTAVGLRVLGDALARGGLPALRALDLGSNSLRDEGGKLVAHRLLAGSGTWRRLARLDLSGNGMGDGGVEAVFKAVTAPGTRLSRDVEIVSVKNNFMSPAARQRLSSPPTFLVL